MNIIFLNIQRIIAHDIVVRRRGHTDPLAAQPIMSDELFDCTEQEMQELIKDRLTNTLGNGSKSVDVEVNTPDTFQKAISLLDSDDRNFINRTKELADRLSNAQIASTIKSGSALFLQGICNYDGNNKRFIAIIKADPDKALCKRVINGSITMELMKELFLSNSQRMVKIALMVELHEENRLNNDACDNDGDFVIKVYDHLMSNSGDQQAALYFYQGFLGCRIASNAATVTRKFLEIGENFIVNSPNISQQERESYKGNLHAYLRGEVTTISPNEVAETIFPLGLREAFLIECNNNNLTSSFTKDISLIRTRLAKRTIKFDTNIVLYIPASVPQNNWEIGNPDEDGWTTMRILGHVIS